MNKSEYNVLGLFVRITDAEKCHKSLNNNRETDYLWPNQWVRNKSGEEEWKIYNYMPENGHIGEIIATLNSSIFDEPVFIIRTFEMFYVPISKSGLKEVDVVEIF